MPSAKKTNQTLVRLISELKKKSHENGAPIWKDVAKRLEKPQRSWAEVNIITLARHTKKNEVVIVPGKLLGAGDINYPVTVAAFSFTRTARTKIREAGGVSLTITELVKMHPKGKNVRIIS